MVDQPNFFREGSPFLQHPLLTAARTAQEVDFVLSQLDLPPGARLLDVGCGFGRHTIELARRGYEVVGIDPAAAMIAAAQERASAAGVPATLRQERGETFTAEQPFDAALCLFTTLGQISETGENSELVARVYDALRSGGRFVVEVPQREPAVQALKTAEKLGEGERYTAVARQFHPASNTVSETFRVVSPQTTRTYLLRYRLFNEEELTALLTRAGFTIAKIYGGYSTDPLTPQSPTILVISTKHS